jgi:MarR family transcriptional regulator, multiple antibiotic resistance protein MarR
MRPASPASTAADEALSRPVSSLEQDLADVNEFGHLVIRLNVALHQLINQRMLEEWQVTETQARVLYLIVRLGFSSAAAIARESGVDPTSVTRIVDRLATGGLLMRRRSADDRRVVRLVPTARGQTIGVRTPAILADVYNTVFNGIDADQIASLKAMLQRIVEQGQ